MIINKYSLECYYLRYKISNQNKITYNTPYIYLPYPGVFHSKKKKKDTTYSFIYLWSLYDVRKKVILINISNEKGSKI